MPRIRLFDFRLSRGPQSCGLLESDLFRVADLCNSAQRRLLLCREGGEEGWYGTWSEMVFVVSRAQPFITLPRGVARIEVSTVCDNPVWVQNQFFEYLDFGNGTLPKRFRCQCGSYLQAYERNNVVTFKDPTPDRRLAIVTTASSDQNKEVIIEGIDTATGDPVRSQQGPEVINGEIVTTSDTGNPVITTTTFARITGIQKDQTDSPIQIFEVDPDTGDQTLISMMEPSEMVAGYRRYYYDALPSNCCTGLTNNCCQPSTTNDDLQVKAIVKLDLVPAQVDTDYLLFQNLEALIEEAKAVRYSEMDTVSAKQFEAVHHRNAVRYLQGELVHYLGAQKPAVNFAPFGTANLNRVKVGSLI